ncbi:YdcF family protein [Thermodesulfovibrio hydrogeniphilus]
MMFFLKKLLTSLILPPGLFILIFIFIAFVEKKRKSIRIIAIFSALFLYLISIEPAKDLIFYPLEKKYETPKTLEADAIVVLGGGVRNENSFSEDTANRTISAYFVHQKTKLPIIVSGGAGEGKIADALFMSDFLVKIGIERENLIVEKKSRDTSENAIYVSHKCKEKNFKKVILVTSAYHMQRAKKLFNKAGVEVLPYPTDFKIRGSYNIYDFLPKFSSFYLAVKGLREYLALLILSFNFS